MGLISLSSISKKPCFNCSPMKNLTIKRHQWRSGASIVNFEHISRVVLVFLLLKYMFSAFIPGEAVDNDLEHSAAISYSNCIKYARIRVFSDQYIPV